ncbi:MAG: hypothetical protein WCB22_26925, partial [Pseudolabrys sp.]
FTQGRVRRFLSPTPPGRAGSPSRYTSRSLRRPRWWSAAFVELVPGRLFLKKRGNTTTAAEETSSRWKRN